MRRRGPYLAAIALAVLAIALPARSTAVALVGSGSAPIEQVVAGIWILKLLLLFHAVALAAMALRRPEREWRALLTLPAERPLDRGAYIGLAAILLVAALARFHHLGAGLWYDEIVALVRFIRLPPGEIVTTYTSQNQHLLYTLLAHGSISLWGEHAAALRLPAAIFGVLSLWSLAWFGNMLGQRREALIAASVLAISYHHVWFSQNARGYTGLLLWTLLGTGMFIQLLQSSSFPGWSRVACYSAVMALGLYTHLTAGFVLAAHGLTWIYVARRAQCRPADASFWVPLVAFTLAVSVAAMLYAPVLPQLWAVLTAPATGGVITDWQNPVWFLGELVSGILAGLPGGWIMLGAALVITGMGVWGFGRQDPSLVLLMLLPAILTVVALVATRHNLWPRLVFSSAGFVALIGIRGVFVLAGALTGLVTGRTGSNHRRAAEGLGAAICGLIVLGVAIGLPAAWRPKQDFEGARDYIEAQRAEGDVILTVDLAQFPYERYLETGWEHVSGSTALRRAEEEGGRTWVVYTFTTRLSAVEPEIWSRLGSEYEVIAEFDGTVKDGSVRVAQHERARLRR